MTVEDLLKEKCMQGSKLVAGKSSRHNKVTGVNVMEVPDIINWVKEGELLLTAGYSYRKKPEEFAELIPAFVEKGVACLGIKSHRYFSSIPQCVIDMAERYSFPVIEVSEEVIFSDVVRETIEQLAALEYEMVSGTLAKITELSELILSSVGLQGILVKMAEYVGNPILIQTNEDSMVASEPNYEQAEIDENDCLLQTEKYGFTRISIEGRDYKTFFYNMVHQGEYLARLYIICKNRTITNAEITFVGKTLFLIGMELQNEGIRRKVESKYIDQMLQSWVLGKIENVEHFKMQTVASRVNIQYGSKYNVIVINLNANPREDQKYAIMQRLRKNLTKNQDVFVTDVEERLVFLTPMERKKEYSKMILELCETVFGAEAGVQLCIGKECRDFYNLNDSYQDAVNIAKVAKRFKMTQKSLEYRDVGAYSILYQIPLGKELDDYLSIYVQPLINYDKEHQTNMYETMKAYLDAKGNMKAAAETLFVHYNTIGYRLERIADILKLNIEDYETQFCLNLAIKIYDMYL